MVELGPLGPSGIRWCADDQPHPGHWWHASQDWYCDGVQMEDLMEQWGESELRPWARKLADRFNRWLYRPDLGDRRRGERRRPEPEHTGMATARLPVYEALGLPPRGKQRRYYGGHGTIHQVTHLNVETRDGMVVAVWFRCQQLPFKQQEVTHSRADDMDRSYEHGVTPELVGVVLDEPLR